MSDGEDLIARAINAASFAASNAVYEHAAKFKDREDYLELEQLAERVQHAAVRAGAQAARDHARADKADDERSSG